MRWIVRIVAVLLLLAIAVPAGFRLAAALRETGAELPNGGRLVETATGRVFVIESGTGPAVLFLHGTGAWSALWQPTLAAVAAGGYRAIAFDLPPFGFSDRAANGDYARAAQAERILALLQALEVRPVLVAHSFGAAPGVEAVMTAPDAFAGLVVVNGAVGLGDHERARKLPWLLRPLWLRETVVAMTATNPLMTRRLLAGLLAVKETATPEVVRLLQRPMTRDGSTRTFAEWLPVLLVPERDALGTRPEKWSGLAPGTELIWGDADTVTPLAQGEVLAALAPQARLAMLKGVGHIPQVEAPGAFREALLAALGRIAQR
ncbi:MAG: alpha/beta hydrolase [Pseudooceanicola sp.]|nr:alpha/beta hydrolase [Pseudooceanicola sp.]